MFDTKSFRNQLKVIVNEESKIYQIPDTSFVCSLSALCIFSSKTRKSQTVQRYLRQFKVKLYHLQLLVSSHRVRTEKSSTILIKSYTAGFGTLYTLILVNCYIMLLLVLSFF